jgi:DNA modification methylase
VNTAAEAVLVLSKEERKRVANGRTSTIARDEFMDWTLGLWDFPGESAKRVGHPSPFPKELPRRLIRLFSFQEDTVLDPFCGSATTLLVARSEGRNAIGIDNSEEYWELARKRIYGTDPAEEVA